MSDEKNQDTHADPHSDQHQDTHSEVADQGRDTHSEVELLRRQIQYLRTLVHTDELTGLSNLRHFNETLSLELERTRRSNQPTCLILMDLDNFKEVNDSYGHEVGNLVLCHLAGLMRTRDSPARYPLPFRRRRIRDHPARNRTRPGHSTGRAPSNADSKVSFRVGPNPP